MDLLIESLKLIGCLALVVVISKYVLVKALRVLAESLRLPSKIVGEIAGFATSVPELLTVIVSAASGLVDTGVYNILSSNIINSVQYGAAVLLNKNGKALKKKAIQIDLLLTLLTIIFPVCMMLFRLQASVALSPVLLALFAVFYMISHFAHKRYPAGESALPAEESALPEAEAEAENGPANNRRNAIFMSAILLCAVGALYLLCTFLGSVLENLAMIFFIPQWALGIVLGFATSAPELITFFESQRHYKDSGNRDQGVVEATSNLLMSNVINLFLVMALGLLINYILH